RLAFAVAAHLEPEILVVDEVLAVGDAAFQKKCLGKMGDVAKAGRTVLFVSHNMGAILNLCPRALLLARGLIVADGPSHSVISHYFQEVLSTTSVPLADRTDRQGSMQLKFLNVGMLNSRNEPISQTIIGEDIKIIIDYETRDEKPLQNVHVA